MLVEAAWTASQAPGLLRAFYQADQNQTGIPVRSRRNGPENDRALLAPHHQRTGPRILPAGTWRAQAPQSRTDRWRLSDPRPARTRFDYNDKEFRRRKREFVEQQERVYETLLGHWQPKKTRIRGLTISSVERTSFADLWGVVEKGANLA